MKNMTSMFLTMMVGVGAGAYLYSYTKKHPVKTQMAKNKMKNMIKDL